MIRSLKFRPLKFRSLGVLPFILLAHEIGAVDANKPQQLADETFTVYFSGDYLGCRDFVEDQGYGSQPARISVLEEKLSDRSLRLQDVKHLELILPRTVECADFTEELANVPQAMQVRRVVERTVTDLFVKSPIADSRTEQRTFLVAKLSIELPFLIEGDPAVLRGQQRWYEGVTETIAAQRNPPTNSSSYIVRTHPQADSDYGLQCGFFDNKFLTIGKLWGDRQANHHIGKRDYGSEELCHETRMHWLELFQAEDPGNWGTHIRVNRDLKLQHRYIIDGPGNDICQEIELEELSAVIRGETFRSAKSFPIKNVDMEYCLP